MRNKLDLTSLTNALALLRRGIARHALAPDDEELRDACIQGFEYCLELSWKMLHRRLALDLPNPANLDGMSYRDFIRTGAEPGLIADASAWMLYREKRNTTSHTYNAEKAANIAQIIPAFEADALSLLAALRKSAGD